MYDNVVNSTKHRTVLVITMSYVRKPVCDANVGRNGSTFVVLQEQRRRLPIAEGSSRPPDFRPLLR
jgi:hypothetical protein